MQPVPDELQPLDPEPEPDERVPEDPDPEAAEPVPDRESSCSSRSSRSLDVDMASWFDSLVSPFSFSLEVSSALLWLAVFCPPGVPPCTDGVVSCVASAVATSSLLLGDSSSCSRFRGEEQRDWNRGDSAPSRSAGVWLYDWGVLLRDGAPVPGMGTGLETTLGPVTGVVPG